MKILAGLYKGKTIKLPKAIRVTTQRTKKTLFDILVRCVAGAEFLDLFAGSGGVGLEALSQGARRVTFVEKQRSFTHMLRLNIANILKDKPASAEILTCDVFQAFKIIQKRSLKFDIVFLDPPYYTELAKKTLIKLAAYDILKTHALIAVEHYRKDELSQLPDKFRVIKKAPCGSSQLTFLILQKK